MTSARRQARRTYHGLVGGKRLRGNIYTGGGARRMAVKTVGGRAPRAKRSASILFEPRVKANGKWSYRFRKLRSVK